MSDLSEVIDKLNDDEVLHSFGSTTIFGHIAVSVTSPVT